MIISKLKTIINKIKINTFNIQCFFVSTAISTTIILSLTRTSYESKLYIPDNPSDYVAEEAVTLVSFGLSIILVSKFLLKLGIYVHQSIFNKANISVTSSGRTLFCSGMLALALFLRGSILVAFSDIRSRSRCTYKHFYVHIYLHKTYFISFSLYFFS